jgi:hypothetical protein
MASGSSDGTNVAGARLMPSLEPGVLREHERALWGKTTGELT